MSKFEYEKNEISAAPCISCVYWFGGDTCKAFDSNSGIPNEILVGKNDHRKPYPGDNDIHYSKRKDKDE